MIRETEKPGRNREECSTETIHRKMSSHGDDPREAQLVVCDETHEDNARPEQDGHPLSGAAIGKAEKPRAMISRAPVA